MENILSFSHTLLKSSLNENSVVVDFTVGNGNDTLFLSKYCSKGKVYGFDVQSKAITTTQALLDNNNIKNTKLILDSHEYISNYINENINGGIFNLGYLPNSDKSVITTFLSTKMAIENALPLLLVGGIIVVVCYIGHSGGMVEANELKGYLKKLSNYEYSVLCYDFINKVNCPFILAVKKIR